MHDSRNFEVKHVTFANDESLDLCELDHFFEKKMKYVVKDLIRIILRQGIRFHEMMNFTTDLRELDYFKISFV